MKYSYGHYMHKGKLCTAITLQNVMYFLYTLTYTHT
jgi:hypothetical protein